MKKFVIFGSGDHAKVILSELIIKKNKIIGFVDENKKKGELIIKLNKKNFFNLGNISEILKNNKNLTGIIGVGLNHLRKKIYQKILTVNKNFKFAKVISNNAIVNSNVEIGDGTFVSPGVIINIGTKIKNHCIINTSCSIDHDNYFDEFSSTGPGVITGGNVFVGRETHIGMGSIIKNNIRIQKNSLIGSNSYVNKNCEKNCIYFGSPAKKKSNMAKNYNYLKTNK